MAEGAWNRSLKAVGQSSESVILGVTLLNLLIGWFQLDLYAEFIYDDLCDEKN